MEVEVKVYFEPATRPLWQSETSAGTVAARYL